MAYLLNTARTREYATAALGAMTEHGILPMPNNFTVWFHYFANTYPDLVRSMKALLDDKAPITNEVCGQLFVDFFTFSADELAFHEASGMVEVEVSEVLDCLVEMNSETASYAVILKDARQQLSANQVDGSGPELVGKLLTSTASTQRKNLQLGEQLKDSLESVSRLKRDLEELRRRATVDLLTGVANRKKFEMVLTRAAMDAMEEKEDLCLLIADIDHFKAFNAKHGSQVGDQVLKLVSQLIGENIKGQDTLARYGGEEFAVILPRTSLANAVLVAESIRDQAARKSVMNRRTGQEVGKISLSVGVACFENGEPLSRLISRVDEALGRAKDEGRNRVIAAPRD